MVNSTIKEKDRYFYFWWPEFYNRIAEINERKSRQALIYIRFLRYPPEQQKDWIGRENVRGLCIQPVKKSFKGLSLDGQVIVRKLIMMLSTRSLRIARCFDSKNFSYRSVLKGRVGLYLPWNITVRIIRFYIVIKAKAEAEKAEAQRRKMIADGKKAKEERKKFREERKDHLRKKLEWIYSNKHKCECDKYFYDPNEYDYWEDCCCYDNYLDYIKGGGSDYQGFLRVRKMYPPYNEYHFIEEDYHDHLENDHHHSEIFPDGEIGQDCRVPCRKKAQKRKSRYRTPKKRKGPKGPRNSKRNFLLS